MLRAREREVAVLEAAFFDLGGKWRAWVRFMDMVVGMCVGVDGMQEKHVQYSTQI